MNRTGSDSSDSGSFTDFELLKLPHFDLVGNIKSQCSFTCCKLYRFRSATLLFNICCDEGSFDEM